TTSRPPTSPCSQASGPRARRWTACARAVSTTRCASARLPGHPRSGTAARATRGICLGLQLALEWTEEDEGVDGLGLLPGRAVRLRGGRVPRIGWAPVDGRCDGDAFYFAHSYAAETPHATAWSEGIVAE